MESGSEGAVTTSDNPGSLAQPLNTEYQSNGPTPSVANSANDDDRNDTEEDTVSDLLRDDTDAMQDVDAHDDRPHLPTQEQNLLVQPTLPPPTVSEPSKNGTAQRDTQFASATSETSASENVEAMEVDDHDDDGDEDEDEDEEDDGSELSDGGDLLDDLEDALGDHNFAFNGNFYHSGILTTAPNPCLTISGLGMVGLPLSERDAKAIISHATLAPFGRGERTVVDKEVRDTWEIEPDKLSFANSQWEKYINGSVCTEVCRALGVNVGNSPPKMELYKLLLYETGSHFLPHQDTEKSSGMFATVVVVLPSPYTGGQVVVSHATTTKAIDFAGHSLLSTALLAWYTDVRHEVKPITSGYRLALSYNLIHTAPPSVPRPSLPSMGGSVGRLRHILRKWKNDRYSVVPSDPPVVAYILRHQYSKHNIDQGISILKGADAQRVTFLQDIAEDLGFMIGLANMTHTKSGPAEDTGGGYHRRSRYDRYYDEYDDEGDDDPEDFCEIDTEETTITGLVDLDGNNLLSVGDITLGENCLIPAEPFQGEPDEREYEGYQGNYAGSLEHWYHRTCLVIMHENDVDGVCFSVGGVDYAIQKLKHASSPPTDTDKLWASRVLSKTNSLSSNQALMMLDFALNWNDASMWSTAMKSPACAIGAVKQDKLLMAWKQFGWETVRVSFETILARSIHLSERIKLIYNIKPQASREDKAAVHAWCNRETDKVLAAYTKPEVKDISTIMTVIRVVGLGGFSKKMLPNLLKSRDSYTFWIAFIKALREARQGFIDRLTRSLEKKAATAVSAAQEGSASNEGQPSGGEGESDPTADPSFEASSEEQTSSAPPGQDTSSAVQESEKTPTAAPILDASALDLLARTNKVIDEILAQGLKAASSQWSNALRLSPYNHNYGYGRYQNSANTSVPQTGKIDRIIEIIEQAFIANDMSVCKTLFVEILRNPGPANAADKFAQLYTPLIPRLKTVLANKRLDFTSPPFIDLIQIFIGTYLRDVLGKKGQMLCTKLRKIGCGCTDCTDLDRFVLDPNSSTQTFRILQKRRQHLEQRCEAARDLCTYLTIRTGSPHAVQVTKLPAIVAACRWETRLVEAKAFLKGIGPDATIQAIMGPRYGDVVNALAGTQSFGGVPATHAPGLARGAGGLASAHSALSTTTVNARPTVQAMQPPMASLQPPVQAAASSSNAAHHAQPTAAAAAAAGQPSQHAGKKRKVTPVNIGFIDLSGDD